MITTFSRTLKEALKNFYRNSWLAIASVSVLALSLYIVGFVYMLSLTFGGILQDIQQKVNVSAYFKSTVSEERIMEIKGILEKDSRVKSVEYISKEKALEDFKKEYADSETIMQSLEEIRENPLSSSLVLLANDPAQYQSLADFLKDSQFADDILRVNYERVKDIINNLSQSINLIRRIGLVLAIIFSAIAILITFNTIRITIYTHKPEIEVMRLVGASNIYIRLPFVFEGIIYGLVASLISLGLIFLTIQAFVYYIPSAGFENLGSFFLIGKKMSAIFINNLVSIFLMQTAFGILLGIFSGSIAIRKYLKI